MFAIHTCKHVFQRAAFMLLAAIIVTAGLSLNAVAIQPERVDYSVTVTQLA